MNRTLVVLLKLKKGMQKTLFPILPLVLILALGLPMGLPARAETAPVIWTDKWDYAPEETVYIFGGGFNANVDLLVRVIRPDGSVITGDSSGTLGSDTITTDSAGSFTYSYILDGIEGLYTIDVLSGDIILATTTFTDASTFVSIAVGGQTGSLTYGSAGTATYLVTVNRSGSGNLDVALGISGLPAGATGSFSPSTVSFTGNTPSSKTSVLTISSVASTPAGTTTFTVTGTAGSTTKTAYGTLTVDSQRAITVTADPQSKVYGDADPDLTYQITSGLLVGTDTITGALSRNSGEDVGTYAITQGSLSAGPNYDLTYFGANLTIYYGFKGLLPPYMAPPKMFKLGSTIPLKWQYTDFAGNVIESLKASPSIKIKFLGNSPYFITVNDAGNSGLRYDKDSKMWIFNWQTKGLSPGLYEIQIICGESGQTDGSFQIQLK